MQFFLLIVIIIVIVVVVRISKSGGLKSIFEDKGTRGERLVGSELAELPDEYYVLNDVLLKTWNGKTSQIDHIVVSKYGVFVIETKNYSGKIYGSENAMYWKEYFNSYRRYYLGDSESYDLYNPVKQNEGHIRTLKKLLSKIGDIHCFSIIAFSNDAELKVSVSSAEVTHLRYLDDVITSHRVILLTDEKVAAIVGTIEKARLNENETEVQEHIAKAHNAKLTSYERVQNGKCPFCDRELVLKNGPYGPFYACPNFPSCRYKLPNS